MPAPLLASKLFVPLVPASLVARPQLLARVDGGMKSRLILISAPPGFGKTTLLAEWIRDRHVPSAWISLDDGDNDPARFLSYLIAAFESLGIQVNERVLASMQTPQGASLDAPLTILLNAVANHAQTSVVVLDDYHLISVPAVHAATAFLVEHAPPNLHLVLATREDPPLPLSHWRGRGQLVELRAGDLRMTSDQATTFLNEVMQLGLKPDEVEKLESKTEGWAAGLQMAALSMQGMPNVSPFVDSFSGSHRFILDYLADEVLAHQPKPVFDFLLSTCIVERLCSSLCDALTLPAHQGTTVQNSIQAMLERLEAGNVFLAPLDQERRWFRYHHLFADILRYRLKQERPALIPELHRRAAAWFEQNGLMAEAIQNHFAAGDLDAAARIIEQAAPALVWQRGEVTTVVKWLEALPEELVAARPALAVLDGWLKLTVVKLDEVERRLAQAERVLPKNPEPERAALKSEIAVMRAMVCNFRGDIPGTIERCESALEHLPDKSVFQRGIILGNLGGAYASCGQVVPAARAFAQGAELGQQTGQMFLGLVSLAYLGEMEMLQGHLAAAERVLQRALDWAREQGLDALPIAALANVGMGGLLLEWNRLEAAEQFIDKGIASCVEQAQVLTGWSGTALLNGYLASAHISTIQRKLELADQAIAKARALALRYMPASQSRIAAAQARVWLMAENLSAALGWAAACGLSADDSPAYTREPEYLTLARVLIAQGKAVEALTLLDRMKAAAEKGGRGGIVIEATFLQALAHHASGDTEASLRELENALSRAEPEGYIRLFLDEGRPAAQLLQRIRDEGGRMEGYALRLLGALAETLDVHTPTPAPRADSQIHHAGIEPLSERELEVLGLVALGLSNQEIADKLIITVPTVKKHLSNVFGKLGVDNRTMAVARAREIGML